MERISGKRIVAPRTKAVASAKPNMLIDIQAKMQSLKQEYAVLLTENRRRYPVYKQAREKMAELLTIKNNVERILGVTEKEKNRDRQQEAR